MGDGCRFQPLIFQGVRRKGVYFGVFGIEILKNKGQLRAKEKTGTFNNRLVVPFWKSLFR